MLHWKGWLKQGFRTNGGVCPQKVHTDYSTPHTMKRFNPTSLTLLALAALSTGAVFGQASSQLPISRTSGIIDVSAPAAATTYVGLPFIKPAVANGELTAISGTTLTDSTAAFGDLTTTPHALQIIGGPGNGAIRRITANTSTTLTVDSAITGIVASVSLYVIIPEWTLGELLGATNQAGLKGGSSPGVADKVQIESGGIIVNYFYKLAAPPFDATFGWRLVSAPTGSSQVNARIPLKGGIVLIRQAGTNRTLTLHGVSRTGTQVAPIATGANVLTNPFASATTLATSNLQAAITGGTSPGVADKVRVENGGVVATYFFKLPAPPFDATTGWRLVSAPTGADQGAVSISAGKSIIVNRLGAVSNWTRTETFATAP